MNTFISRLMYSYVIDYLSGNNEGEGDTISIYDHDVTITTLDKPTFIFNYTPPIRLQLSSPPRCKSWVLGIYLVEQLYPAIRENVKNMLQTLQGIKDTVYATYGITTHLVILTNFEQNKQIFDAGGVDTPIKFQSFFLPYQLKKEEQLHLRDIFASTPKEYDVAFVGALSERRKQSIELCRQEGLRVNVIQKFGDERDIETAKCHILMSSHYYDNSSMYTNIRCDRLLFQDMPILSETCSDQDILDIKSFITFTDLQYIGKKAKEILSTPLRMTDSDKERIYMERQEHLQSVKSAIFSLMNT